MPRAESWESEEAAEGLGSGVSGSGVRRAEVKAVVVRLGAKRAVSSCQLTMTDLGQTTRTRKDFRGGAAR